MSGPVTYQIYRLVLNIFDYDLMWIGITIGTLICINIMFNLGLITFHKKGKNISLIIVLLFSRLIFGPEGTTFHTFHLRLIGHTSLILIFFLLVRRKSKTIFFISGILFGLAR